MTSSRPRVSLTKDDKARIMNGKPIIYQQESAIRNPNRRRAELVEELAELQSWRCFWCGREMTRESPESLLYRTLEHVTPKASGKIHVESDSNYRAACRRCNQIRAKFNVEWYEARITILHHEIDMRDQIIEVLEALIGGRSWLKMLVYRLLFPRRHYMGL